METQPTPVEVFCSYAHEDEAWLRKLETHLSLLERQGLISFWHDRLIAPGIDWAQDIDQHLETASVILLLVSADFLASDYCYSIEMTRALERQEAGEARVIPILVRPVDWKGTPFAHLQSLPTDAKPIATWRDKDTALSDVIAGLRRVIVDELPFLSASAAHASLPAIWNIPYPRNPFFLGRDEILADLRHLLLASQTAALSQPQAVSGLGGIGKTQVALEYAYRYHQNYQAVLWASAETSEALISSYVALASLLRLPERKAKEQEIMIEAVRQWLQTHGGWLLIFDNADDLAVLSAFVPPSLGGHVLLTTRARATGQLAHWLEIETLVPEQGALFLLRRSGLLPPDMPLKQATQEEQTLAIQISQELGGLPLALDQAGAYLEETGAALSAYWQLYQQYRAELLRERRGVAAMHPLSVATIWSVSFQRVEERNPAAADLLRLLAWLSPDAIAEEILPAGATFLGPLLTPIAENAWLLNQAIEALRAYSLIRRDPKAQTLSIHRLVQAVLQDQQGEEERRIWTERAMQTINAAFPRVEYGTWAQCERLLPLALVTAQRIEQEHIVTEDAGRVLHETASYLRERARFGEAEPLYQRALRIREQQLGPEHPDVAHSLNGLANLYTEQGKHVEAEPLYRRALRIREQQLGPEHPDVAISLNGLANLFREQSKYGEAEPLYQRALRIREQQLGPEHPQVAYPLNNLANLYREQGKHGEAEPLYQRALCIFEQQLGPEHPQVAYPLNNLASLYLEQGKYGEAEPLYQRALRIWEHQLGPEHPNVAHSLNGLAELYREQGKYGEAEPLYQRALRIWEQQVASEHPEMAYPLNNLANLYREQGKYGEAEPLYQRALRIREQQLGHEHIETAETVHDLAVFQETLMDHQQALSLYQRALSIRNQVLGSAHPMTRATHQRLISLLQQLDQETVDPVQKVVPPEQGEQIN